LGWAWKLTNVKEALPDDFTPTEIVTSRVSSPVVSSNKRCAWSGITPAPVEASTTVNDSLRVVCSASVKGGRGCNGSRLVDQLERGTHAGDQEGTVKSSRVGRIAQSVRGRQGQLALFYA
jgi:hypothetical protein